MGLLSLDPVDVERPGRSFRATPLSRASYRSFTSRRGRDLVALRVVVSGKKNGAAASKSFELVDRYDEKHDVSAMMRTTGYSLSITGLMQARGQVKPAGVHTPDECVPPAAYVAELRKRGIDIKES